MWLEEKDSSSWKKLLKRKKVSQRAFLRREKIVCEVQFGQSGFSV